MTNHHHYHRLITTNNNINNNNNNTNDNNEENNKEIALSVDEALERIGPCGRYQLFVQLFFMVLVMTIGYQGVLTHFVGDNPPWPCHKTHYNLKVCRSIVPRKNSKGDFAEPPNGRRFPFLSEVCKSNKTTWMVKLAANRSIVGEEIDYTCEVTSITVLTTLSFYLGGIVGCFVSGILADEYGRRRVLILSVFLVVVSSIECSFVSEFWQLSVVRGILGASQMSAFLMTFISLLEFMAPSQRAVSTGFFHVAVSVSKLVIDVMSYEERNWRKLQYYSSFPPLVPFFLLFFISDSPRWLLCKKRKKSATAVLRTISIRNENSSTFKLKYLDTYGNQGLRSKKMFVATLILGVAWTAAAILEYNILALLRKHFNGSFHEAFALSALADIPGNLAAIATCTRFGRRKSVFWGLSLSGLLVYIAAVTPAMSYKTLVKVTTVAVALTTKFLMNIVNNGLALWSFELLPTVVRARGLGFCVTCKISGTFAAPFVVFGLQNVFPLLNNITVGLIALACAVLCLALPETANLQTRETIEDFGQRPDGYEVIGP